MVFIQLVLAVIIRSLSSNKNTIREEYSTSLIKLPYLNVFLIHGAVSTKEQMKPTNSDLLQVTGLLFFDNETREYIPYILAGSDRGKRLNIDE